MSTEVNLDEIREALEKATPGPWILNEHASPLGDHRVESEHEHGVVNDGWAIAEVLGSDAKPNGALIANAPTWLSSMHYELTRRRAEDETHGRWVISNGKTPPRYTAMGNDGFATKVVDVEKALWFSRRQDAEAFAAEDEDAWSIFNLDDSHPTKEGERSDGR